MITKPTQEHPASLIYCPYFDDERLYTALQKFSDGWPWVGDCCQWVTREEATALQEAGVMKPESNYRKVKHFGLICSEHGMTYTGTKDKLLQGISDFVEGWQTAMKVANPVIEAGRWHEHWNPTDLEHKVKSKRMKLGKVSN